MKDIRWMVRRLRAMSPEELVWRVREKQRTRREKKEFYAKKLPVTEIPLAEELKKSGRLPGRRNADVWPL